uniref:pre-toxin TG domain-containing protein n=1 Tax=Marinagarivorans algicola TaxID=1513270 RepID=UPI0012E2ED59
GLIKRARSLDKKYQDRAKDYRNVLQNITNKDLNDIKASDMEYISELSRKVEALKTEINTLLVERDALQVSFNEKWTATSENLNGIINSFGIVLDDFDTSFALNVDASDIELIAFAQNPNFNPEIYNQYAKNTINRLKQLNANNENRNFLNQVKLWLDTAANLESVLTEKSISAPEEWRALNDAFDEVEDYIFSVVDRNFWFKDSALTLSQKNALIKISDVNAALALLMERDLRTYRTINNTAEKQDILTLLEAVGNGLKEDEATAADAPKYNDMLNGLAEAIAKESVCLAKTLALSDIGDIYEVTIGKSLCTGEPLSTSDRLISSLGLFAFSGRFWRGAAKAAGLGGDAKTIITLTRKMKDYAKVMKLTPVELDDFAHRMAKLYPCKNK